MSNPTPSPMASTTRFVSKHQKTVFIEKSQLHVNIFRMDHLFIDIDVSCKLSCNNRQCLKELGLQPEVTPPSCGENSETSSLEQLSSGGDFAGEACPLTPTLAATTIV